MPTTATTSPDPAGRRVFAMLAIVAAIVVAAGFAGSYYLRPLIQHVPGSPAARMLPPVVHLHAALFTAWVVLLVLQSTLVLRGLVPRHRALGRVATGLVPLMLLSGFAAALTGGREGWNPGGPYRDALSFMFVGITDLMVFATLTVLALLWRTRPALHARLMILGTLGGLMWPAITRLPGVAGRPLRMFALIAVLVLALPVRDLLTGARYRWLSLTLAIAVLATFPLRVAIANSDAWRSVAAWLVQ